MAGNNIIPISFHVMAHASYQEAVTALRNALAAGATGDVDGRPILAVQTGEKNEPARWIHVHIHAPGGASPTIAIRGDNVYLVGFTNRHNHWHEFGKRGDTMLLPGATPLGFSGSYLGLVGGSSNVPTLALGKYDLIHAVNTLWYYSPRAAEDDDGDDDNDNDPERVAATTVKIALARLVVALCEGARFPPVYNAVNATWEKVAAHITGNYVTLINNWENLSSALIGGKNFGNDFVWPQNLVHIGIPGKAEALPVIYLLLNKPPPPPRPPRFFVDYIRNMFRSVQALVRGMLLGVSSHV